MVKELKIWGAEKEDIFFKKSISFYPYKIITFLKAGMTLNSSQKQNQNDLGRPKDPGQRGWHSKFDMKKFQKRVLTSGREVFFKHQYLITQYTNLNDLKRK